MPQDKKYDWEGLGLFTRTDAQNGTTHEQSLWLWSCLGLIKKLCFCSSDTLTSDTDKAVKEIRKHKQVEDDQLEDKVGAQDCIKEEKSLLSISKNKSSWIK